MLLGKWQHGQLQQSLDLSALQSHESDQSHHRKIPHERHVHHVKQGKFPPHPPAHENGHVENQCHYVQTEYRPDCSTIYRVKSLVQDARKRHCLDILLANPNHKYKKPKPPQLHHYAQANLKLHYDAICRFHH